ncbi:hypothetical protein [Pseudomonas sp. EZ-C24]|uniref:hypothetical protein n=1 Tax=Pseudomonas sp. EZ-C24 TaxID=2753617 RepID=UPI00165DC706|nr:hypothetical protein [Pseudomonas sp. EZ-C24]
MTRLALCLLLLATLAGCEPMTPEQITQRQLDYPFSGAHIEHDDARGVTCWVSDDSRAGLSCLPDWMLRGPDQAGNERQLSPHEKDSGPTPALAPGRWIDERYEL